MLAGNALADGVGERGEAGVRTIAGPTTQRDGLDFSEAERRFHRIEADRNIYISSLRAARFVTNKIAVMADRPLGPDDDDAFGGVEMFLDVLAPVSAATDMRIPPHAEAFGFQGSNQRLDARSVLGLIGYEYVCRLTGHSSP